MTHFTKIGRYEILAELGQGAMGAVYKARDPLMDRTVAVKTILAGALSGPMATEYRERFAREAKAAGRLSHPSIVAVYDVGEHEGIPFLVMEYVPGRTLAQALESGERFPFDRIYDIGQQCAEALDLAHRQGVIHRDVKPANILLTVPPEGGLERAKIGDFGVAKLSATQMTATGQLLGTPSFMPPESFTGSPIDGRSDIFSLGVILYWMATGDKPFTGDTITAVSYKIVHTDIIPPRKLNPAIPAGFERIILRCLQKDPALRFQSGAELARAIDDLRRGRDQTVVTGAPALPVAAAPPGHDPDATLDVLAPAHRPAHPATAYGPPQTVATPPPLQPAPRRSMGWKLPAALLSIIIVVGVVMVARRSRAPELTSLPATAPTQAVEQPTTPATKQEAAPAPAVSEAPSKHAEHQQSVPAAPPPVGGVATPPPAPPVSPAFPDEKQLREKIQQDTAKLVARAQLYAKEQEKRARLQQRTPVPIPAGHARLRIDATGLPESLTFVVLSGEQVVFRRTRAEAGPGPVYVNVFVPEGQHMLRVFAGVSGMRFGASNEVRGMFREGEERTLRLALAAGKQLVIALK